MKIQKFKEPPLISSMSQLEGQACGPHPRAMVNAAIHESAHALADILFDRPAIRIIVCEDGTGKTWSLPPVPDNAGTDFQDSVNHFVGVFTEKVICGSRNREIEPLAERDFHHAHAYAVSYADWSVLRIADFKTLSERQQAMQRKRYIDAAICRSHAVAAVIVYRYIGLVAQMAYVTLRDSFQRMYDWSGDSRKWAEAQIERIDSCPLGKRKTVHPMPENIKKLGRKRTGIEQLAVAREIRAEIQVRLNRERDMKAATTKSSDPCYLSERSPAH